MPARHVGEVWSREASDRVTANADAGRVGCGEIHAVEIADVQAPPVMAAVSRLKIPDVPRQILCVVG